jgi:hypothetical protein
MAKWGASPLLTPVVSAQVESGSRILPSLTNPVERSHAVRYVHKVFAVGTWLIA